MTTLVHFPKHNLPMDGYAGLTPAKAFALWPAAHAVTIDGVMTKLGDVSRMEIFDWQDKLFREMEEAIDSLYGKDSGQGVSTKESIAMRREICRKWAEQESES